jgi:hypothetical protein
MDTDFRQQFDLSGLERLEQERNSTRNSLRVYAGLFLGTLVVLVGIDVGVLHGLGSTSMLGSGTVLVLVGIAIVIGTWYYGKSVQLRQPNLLTLSNEELILAREGGSASPRHLSWQDPRIRIVIHDRSVLHAKMGDRDRYSEYRLILPPSGQALPIPKAAFDLIMTTAEGRGLRIRKQEFGFVRIFTVDRPNLSH